MTTGSVARQFLDVRMIVRPHDQPVEVTAQHPGRIGDRLPASELYIVIVQEYGIPSKLPDPHLERNPRARARLGEYQRPGLVLERRRNMATALGLAGFRQRKNLRDFVEVEVGVLEKVFHSIGGPAGWRRADVG